MTFFKTSILFPLLSFIALFAIGVYGVHSFGSVEQKEQRLLLDEIVNAQASAIERRLTRSLSSTYILAQEIRRSNGNFQGFDKYADEVILTLGGISNLQLAPNGIIERIYPLPGNEKAIGHNILSDDARRKEAHLAIQTRSLMLAGPFDLIQGGTAIIGRNPVFLKKNGQDYFWGFVSALIFLEDLLAVTELDQLRGNGYEFHLSRLHPDTSEVEIFSRSGGNLGAHPVTRRINVPNGSWILRMSRPHVLQSYYKALGIIISLVIAIIFSLLLNRIIREPERLRVVVKKKTEALEQLAFHDDLTGLANRRFLSGQLIQAIRNLKRHEGHIAILYLDLDDFKRINDSMGHETGDRLLQQVAQRINNTIRDNDIVARMGGDEFAVILLDLNTPDEARIIAEKIIENVRRPMHLDQREIVISASVGATLAPDDSQSIVALFRNADLAMFDSKRAGKNQFSFFNIKMQQNATRKLLLEEQLRQAIDKEEFYLAYQPIISLNSYQVEKFEVLLRWRHPQKGEQYPGSFIEVAESTGLIIPISYWVITSVCHFIDDQQQAGQKAKPVTINISARQLKDERFAERVEEIFTITGIDPRLVELEITESMLMEDIDLAIKLINSLKRIGMRILIDDFGTGYSSLAQLKKLPVNALKIDRSFVKDLEKDISDRQIVEAITAMAHKLGIEVVAEGIETKNQLHILKEFGSDYGQGFLISKPMSANDACKFNLFTNIGNSEQE